MCRRDEKEDAEERMFWNDRKGFGSTCIKKRLSVVGRGEDAEERMCRRVCRGKDMKEFAERGFEEEDVE